MSSQIPILIRRQISADEVSKSRVPITKRSSDLEKTRTLENETLRLKGNESLKKHKRIDSAVIEILRDERTNRHCYTLYNKSSCF